MKRILLAFSLFLAGSSMSLFKLDSNVAFPTIKPFSSPLDRDPPDDDSTIIAHSVVTQKRINPGATKSEADFKLKRVTTSPSPLDTDASNPPRDSSIDDTKSTKRDLLGDLETMSSCEKDCSKGLTKALGLVLKTMSHVERYQQICEQYNIAHTCITEERKCHEVNHEKEEGNMGFEIFSSGLRYMCVEQALAFNSTIHCIDSEAGRVQTECEVECQTKNVVMNWIMRSSIARGIQDGLSGLQGGSPLGSPGLPSLPAQNPQMMDNLRQMSNDLCKVGDCVLRCLKSKFNARCEGVAGTLLAEVFVRPIASGQERMSMMAPFLGMIVPQECSFLYSANELGKHRIDPSLDSELRRMYHDKEAEKLNVVMENTTEDPSVVQMFKLPTVPSPFDGKTDINSLIEEMYRQSDTTYSDDANLSKEMNEDGLLTVESRSMPSSPLVEGSAAEPLDQNIFSNSVKYKPERNGLLRCALRKVN